MLPISSGLSRYCCSQAHDEIELLFLLHHLGGGIAADGGLDQGIDVGDVQAVARDPRAVDLDGQARLPEFLHQGDVPDAAHPLEDLLDGLALLLQRLQVGAEHLDGERAFQAGLRLVHRVFGRLGVVEDDAGKGRELLVDRVDQSGLVAIGAVPLRVGFQADVEFDVEEAGGIGAVVGAAEFRGDRGDLRKGCAGSARTCGAIFADSSNEMVYGMVARTQSAPSSRCGMNSAPMRGMSSSEPTSSSAEASVVPRDARGRSRARACRRI